MVDDVSSIAKAEYERRLGTADKPDDGKLNCARCKQDKVRLAFPDWPQIRVCGECLSKQRKDTAKGQMSIFDFGASPYDGTENNTKEPRRNDKFRRGG